MFDYSFYKILCVVIKMEKILSCLTEIKLKKTSEFVFVVINFNGKLCYTESPQEYLMEQNSEKLGIFHTLIKRQRK